MPQTIPDRYRDLFAKRAFASLSTLMPDGSPQVSSVWCDVDGDFVIFNTVKGRQKIGISVGIGEWRSPLLIPTIHIVIWIFVGV